MKDYTNLFIVSVIFTIYVILLNNNKLDNVKTYIETVQGKNALAAAVSDLSMITGQKPRENKAKKSVANFKLREGMIIGVSVTLRRDRMWDFFDRLVNIALPRIRDFRGINPKSFDGNGNYSLGLREQVTFPEINYTEVDKLEGYK